MAASFSSSLYSSNPVAYSSTIVLGRGCEAAASFANKSAWRLPLMLVRYIGPVADARDLCALTFVVATIMPNLLQMGQNEANFASAERLLSFEHSSGL